MLQQRHRAHLEDLARLTIGGKKRHEFFRTLGIASHVDRDWSIQRLFILIAADIGVPACPGNFPPLSNFLSRTTPGRRRSQPSSVTLLPKPLTITRNYVVYVSGHPRNHPITTRTTKSYASDSRMNSRSIYMYVPDEWVELSCDHLSR